MRTTQDEAAYLSHLQGLYRKAWPKDANTAPHYPHGEVPLTDYLGAWAKERPDTPAVIHYGHVTTYAELDAASNRFAHLLASEGVKPGDRVAVFLPNMPQYQTVFFGILKAGAVHVPVSPMSRAFELAHELNDTQAVLLVALDELMPVVREVQANGDARALRQVYVTGFADLLPAAPTLPVPDSLRAPRIACPDAKELMTALATMPSTRPAHEPQLDAIAALNYTGGTTGLPKGCIHTQRDMLYTAASNFGIALERAPDTVFLSFFPQFWIAGENLGVIFPVFCGAPLVLLSRWDPVAVMAAVQRYKVTCMAMPVDGAVEMMDRDDFGQYDLGSLRQVRVVSFVKKLNLAYRRRWQQLTGGILAEAAWGMTETHTSDTFTTGFQDGDDDLHAQPVFVGLPVPGTQFKICDFETGALKALGEDGEIRVRTPSLLKGYWNRPEATAEAIVDGWLRTGDIGLIDADGFLHFLGRKKEMLKVKGMSVFPPEIEAVLGQHPAVLGSGVIGRTDPQRGELPVAFVLLKPEADAATAVQSLTDWCASRMASYKLPEIRLVSALPMTATGKVKKQDLATLL
ncbi:MAG TPA: AMP-binding protein [Aquabacterium sp.]|nr:AMP-binding protein [Aquabacterium sp.]HQC96135.1 AMP-binding protein [Aquabacterium sp.]